MGGNMSIYLKENDIDEFSKCMGVNVGQYFFAHHDFIVDKAEVDEYETEADEVDDGDPSLITSITIEFAMTNNDYDEDGWIRVSRGCTRTFYSEDFENFYGVSA
jgi:hypothetical protein